MKKRALSLALALVMLLSLATLFASCGGKAGEITVSKKTVEVDIKGWELHYAETTQDVDVYKKTITGFSTLLKNATGRSYSVKVVGKSELAEDTPAILIGDTGYEESKKAKKSISGDGFAIQVGENRIVIVGSDDLLTLYAVQYFVDNYLAEHEGGTVLNIPEKASANKLVMVTLASTETGAAPFVYGADCYEDTSHPVKELMGVYASIDMRDAPVVAAAEASKYVQDTLSLKRKDIFVKNDKEDASGTEMLLGYTNRPVSAACFEELSVYEYGFFVKDGQMALCAWNDAQMFTANSMLSDLLKMATKTDKKGNVTIAFPEGFVCKGRSEGDFVTDFPKPEGLTLYHTMDTAEDTLQYVYKGEGVSADAYRAYLADLKTNGYSVITENEIEDSLFATLVNDSEKIMLYVTYNAFAHEEEFDHSYDPLIRVVSASTDKVTVPDASVLTKPTNYKKVTDTAVTAVELIGNLVGMCYIITLEDGSFVVFDGGASGTMQIAGESWSTAEKIWNILNARYEMIFGEKPENKDGKRIRIAAWVVTHSHGDHYGAATSFWSVYNNNKTWEMDYLIGNYPSSSAVHFVADSDINRMSNSQDLAAQYGFTFLKVHTGEKYYFANLEMEVLTTYEDLAPERIKNQNDTSTVLRFTVQATADGVKDGAATNVGAPYTMIWTGDANRQQSRYLCAMYGDYMVSDMVQVAHHGNVGCETDFYDCVQATVVWFAHNVNSFRSYVNAGNRNAGYNYGADYRLMHENPWTKYMIVAGGDGGGANQQARGVDVTLEFGANGLPDFENPYTIDLTAYRSQGKVEKVELACYASADIPNVAACIYKATHNW